MQLVHNISFAHHLPWNVAKLSRAICCALHGLTVFGAKKNLAKRWVGFGIRITRKSSFFQLLIFGNDLPTESRIQTHNKVSDDSNKNIQNERSEESA